MWGSRPRSVTAAIAEVRDFVVELLKDVKNALTAEPEAAKFELMA
jgi:hypothetical protein